MAAEFDNTSFGMQRRREDAAKLNAIKECVTNRLGYVQDAGKLKRLEALLASIDDVLQDLVV